MLTVSYLSPSECADVFDAMDNAGWYWSGNDAYGLEYRNVGPFSSRENAVQDADDCGVYPNPE